MKMKNKEKEKQREKLIIKKIRKKKKLLKKYLQEIGKFGFTSINQLVNFILKLSLLNIIIGIVPL